jgi:hypothetical protein
MGYWSWNIQKLVKVFTRWQENKFDGIIIIDGNRGLGKSTLGLKLAYGMPEFKLKRDLLFTQNEVMEAIAKSKFKTFIADEMINVTYNRDFFSEQQKDIIKMLNMYRDSCNVLIACVPNFWDLDNQIRNLCKMRINIVKRGYAIIHTKNNSSYSTDKWDKAYNEKIEREWLKRKIKNPKYKQLTTFRGIVKFGPLQPAIQKVYDELKATKRNVVYTEQMQKEKKKDLYDTVIELIQKKYIANDNDLIKYYYFKAPENPDLQLRAFRVRINEKLKQLNEPPIKKFLLKNNPEGKSIILEQQQPIAPKIQINKDLSLNHGFTY